MTVLSSPGGNEAKMTVLPFKVVHEHCQGVGTGRPVKGSLDSVGENELRKTIHNSLGQLLCAAL